MASADDLLYHGGKYRYKEMEMSGKMCLVLALLCALLFPAIGQDAQFITTDEMESCLKDGMKKKGGGVSNLLS